MQNLRDIFASKDFVGSSLKATTSSTSFTVKEADDFAYTDPIDGSVSKNQGLYIKFEDGSRIIFRLSGTGSSGATVRLYVEKYSQDKSEYGNDAQDGLKPLIEVALATSKLQEFTGRDKPDVITVSTSFWDLGIEADGESKEERWKIRIEAKESKMHGYVKYESRLLALRSTVYC
jgi:phosphoglucomutase